MMLSSAYGVIRPKLKAPLGLLSWRKKMQQSPQAQVLIVCVRLLVGRYPRAKVKLVGLISPVASINRDDAVETTDSTDSSEAEPSILCLVRSHRTVSFI